MEQGGNVDQGDHPGQAEDETAAPAAPTTRRGRRQTAPVRQCQCRSHFVHLWNPTTRIRAMRLINSTKRRKSRPQRNAKVPKARVARRPNPRRKRRRKRMASMKDRLKTSTRPSQRICGPCAAIAIPSRRWGASRNVLGAKSNSRW